MTRFFFAAHLGCHEYELLPRLRELGYTEPCARCNGTGYYDAFEKIICFRCVGKGDQLPKLTRELASAVAVRIVRGDLEPYLERRQRQAECRRRLPAAFARCEELHEKLGGLGEAIYSHGGNSVMGVARRVGARELDPETALVLLNARLAELQALLPKRRTA